MSENLKEVKYTIQGMDCADCALSLERSLGQIKGVEQVNVNFTTGRMDASGDFDPKELIQRVEALGYHAESPEESAAGKIAGTSDSSPGTTIQLPGFLGYLYSTPQTRLALLGALLLLISIPLSLAANNPQILWVTNHPSGTGSHHSWIPDRQPGCARPRFREANHHRPAHGHRHAGCPADRGDR